MFGRQDNAGPNSGKEHGAEMSIPKIFPHAVLSNAISEIQRDLVEFSGGLISGWTYEFMLTDP